MSLAELLGKQITLNTEPIKMQYIENELPYQVRDFIKAWYSCFSTNILLHFSRKFGIFCETWLKKRVENN